MNGTQPPPIDLTTLPGQDTTPPPPGFVPQTQSRSRANAARPVEQPQPTQLQETTDMQGGMKRGGWIDSFMADGGKIVIILIGLIVATPFVATVIPTPYFVMALALQKAVRDGIKDLNDGDGRLKWDTIFTFAISVFIVMMATPSITASIANITNALPGQEQQQ